jgi:hypothetical protein
VISFGPYPLYSASPPIFSISNVKHNWNGKHIASNVFEFRSKCSQLYRSFCSRSRLILRPLSPRLFRIDEFRSRYATISEPLNRKSQSLWTVRCDLVTAPDRAYLRRFPIETVPTISFFPDSSAFFLERPKSFSSPSSPSPLHCRNAAAVDLLRRRRAPLRPPSP